MNYMAGKKLLAGQNHSHGTTAAALFCLQGKERETRAVMTAKSSLPGANIASVSGKCNMLSLSALHTSTLNRGEGMRAGHIQGLLPA